jgi:hypothetical protein
MMSEEVNKENKPPSPEESIQAIQSSIANAFNLGLQSKPKEGADTIADVVKEIQSTIYGQLKQAYGDVPEDFIKANAEFFVQVAAMGYIIPRVCAFDQDFQAKLFKLIETRVLETQKAAQEQAGEEKGNIITEDKKIII